MKMHGRHLSNFEHRQPWDYGPIKLDSFLKYGAIKYIPISQNCHTNPENAKAWVLNKIVDET
jgi:hypothetical protein